MESPVVLVSGGSRGLGGAVVSDFLARGYRVATFSRSRTPLVDECSASADGRFRWDSLDATDFPALRRFVLSVAEQFGHINGLVNNAGVLVEGVLPLMQASAIHSAISVNLESAIHLTQACVRVMLSHSEGSIVNVSSLNAVRGHAGVSVYSATKAALGGLTRSLARELGPRGIRVNSVAPGYFESEMTGTITSQQREQILRRTPLRRLGTVDDLVGVIRFLLSKDARFLTGQEIVVDGGITC